MSSSDKQRHDRADHADHRDGGLPLAAGVLAWAGILLAPAVGAILMSASTVIVAINAQLLRRVEL